MQDDSGQIVLRVIQLLKAQLDLPPETDLIDDRTSLFSPQIQMDSLNLLQLLVSLEKEFDIEIDDEDVMEADLDTVGSIVTLVRSCVSSGTAVPKQPK